MRGGRRPAEWAVFYSKPPSPIRNRDLHNGRRPFTIVSRVLHFAESRPGGARRRAAPGDPAGAHGFCRSPIDGSRLPVAIVEVPRMLRSPDGKILRNHLIDEYKVVAP